MNEGGRPIAGASVWDDALLAARLFCVDPVGTGGVRLRSPYGPVRERWLALMQAGLEAGAPVRRLPPHIADERLLGGLDLAATLGALIDGVYLRAVLDRRGPTPEDAHAMVQAWLAEALA